MKKYTVIVLATFAFVVGCAMQPFVPTEATEVVDFPGQKQRDIYNKTRQWFSQYFVSGKSVVDYENPATLQLVLESESVAVIGKPVRPFGLLTNLVISRNIWMRQKQQQDRIAKLESKITGQKRIAKAKSILMETQALSEQDAYKSIRAQAMAKRVSMEQIAAAIIHANELLSFRVKDD